MKSRASKRQKRWQRHSFLQVRWTGPWGLFSTFSHSRAAVPLLHSLQHVVSTHLLTSAGTLGSGSTGPPWHRMVSSRMCLLGELQYSLANTATSDQSRQAKPLKGLCYKEDQTSVLENYEIMSQSSRLALQAFGLTATASSLGTTPTPILKQSGHDASSPPAIQRNRLKSLFPHAI